MEELLCCSKRERFVRLSARSSRSRLGFRGCIRLINHHGLVLGEQHRKDAVWKQPAVTAESVIPPPTKVKLRGRLWPHTLSPLRTARPRCPCHGTLAETPAPLLQHSADPPLTSVSAGALNRARLGFAVRARSPGMVQGCVIPAVGPSALQHRWVWVGSAGLSMAVGDKTTVC